MSAARARRDLLVGAAGAAATAVLPRVAGLIRAARVSVTRVSVSGLMGPVADQIASLMGPRSPGSWVAPARWRLDFARVMGPAVCSLSLGSRGLQSEFVARSWGPRKAPLASWSGRGDREQGTVPFDDGAGRRREAAMSFRKLPMIEIREAPRRWSAEQAVRAGGARTRCRPEGYRSLSDLSVRAWSSGPRRAERRRGRRSQSACSSTPAAGRV